MHNCLCAINWFQLRKYDVYIDLSLSAAAFLIASSHRLNCLFRKFRIGTLQCFGFDNFSFAIDGGVNED